VSARYHVGAVDDGKVAGEITDALDQLAREGARLMLERALAAEVDEFLGRERYVRRGEFRGYRNGHGRARTVGVGTWGGAGERAESVGRS
jgi:transposase-like protein